MDTNKNVSVRTRLLLSLLPAALLGVFCYILLHEGGHALVMLACGEKIVTFSIFGAFVSGDGSGSYTVFTKALLNAGGVLLPLIFAVVYVAFYKPKKDKPFYSILSVFLGVVPTFSLLAWVMVPFSYLSGNTSGNDDVIKFLNVSGINPLVVSALAALVFAAAAVLIWKKRVIQTYLEIANTKNK